MRRLCEHCCGSGRDRIEPFRPCPFCDDGTIDGEEENLPCGGNGDCRDCPDIDCPYFTDDVDLEDVP